MESFESDSSSANPRFNNCDNSKASESCRTKVKTYDNNSCDPSDGCSTCYEDSSGFDGEPVSLAASIPAKEGTSDDDDYYEDFYMPNDNEKAFVRHQSFRRKVQLTPINAPDAERIEGLVRTGSFHRHSSVRRKILEEQEPDYDEADSISNLSEQLRQDIEEIEQIILNESKMDNDIINAGGNYHVTSSTPINVNNPSERDYLNNLEFSELQQTDESSLIIEQNTLKKIKDCLDVSKHKNIYHLSGRLQDILTPQEIEDVLINSHRYSCFLTAEVLEALSMSLVENTISDEETGPHDSTHREQISGKSNDEYKSCALNLDLKMIEAPELNLNSIDDNESIGASEIDTHNHSEFLCSSDMLEQSVDRTRNQRKILAEDIYFTSVSCYSTQSVGSDQVSPETDSPIGLSLPFSSPHTDIPPPPPDLIPEADEAFEENHWRNVVIAGDWKRIDMKAVNSYKSFISHGDCTESGSQVVVISAHLLPKKRLKEYNYIMDNLFMYALSILEQLVSDDYILVYFAGGRSTTGPGFHWMRKAYDMIDRRIRKNMKKLLIVHPSLWARTLVVLSKPFISSKFYRKLVFVYSLTDLAQIVPLNNIQTPEEIKQLDFELMINEKKKAKQNRRSK